MEPIVCYNSIVSILLYSMVQTFYRERHSVLELTGNHMQRATEAVHWRNDIIFAAPKVTDVPKNTLRRQSRETAEQGRAH